MSSSTIRQNTTELQEIFDAINNLPEAGSAPNAKEEQTKSLDVTKNGNYNILPDSGKVLSKATVNVAVPERYNEGYGDGKAEGYTEGYAASQNARQEKTFVENGEYTPDEGYSGFSKVTVNVKNVDTVDGWHIDVRSDGSDPPSGTFNTITFGYGG